MPKVTHASKRKGVVFMAKIDQMVASLQKLYAKRGALDKQIISAEKKLAVEAKAAAKPAASAKKSAGKKSKTKKSAAKKTVAKKSAAKKPAPKPAVKPLLKK